MKKSMMNLRGEVVLCLVSSFCCFFHYSFSKKKKNDEEQGSRICDHVYIDETLSKALMKVLRLYVIFKSRGRTFHDTTTA